MYVGVVCHVQQLSMFHVATLPAQRWKTYEFSICAMIPVRFVGAERALDQVNPPLRGDHSQYQVTIRSPIPSPKTTSQASSPLDSKDLDTVLDASLLHRIG